MSLNVKIVWKLLCVNLGNTYIAIAGGMFLHLDLLHWHYPLAPISIVLRLVNIHRLDTFTVVITHLKKTHVRNLSINQN